MTGRLPSSPPTTCGCTTDVYKRQVEAATPAADKKRALETARAQIERAYGKGSIMRLGDNADIVVASLSLPGTAP